MAEVKKVVFVDLSSGYFLEGSQSRQVTQEPFGQFFHLNNLNLEVHLRVPDPSGPPHRPFSVPNVSGASLVVDIWNSAGSQKLATASVFTADAAAGTLSGSLDLNTVEMAAYVTADDLFVIIEFRFTGAFGSVNARARSRIKKQLNTTGTPTPLPGVTYLTTADMALFVLRNGEPGDSRTLVSEDGTKTILEYLSNDGEVKHEPVT